MNDPLTPADIEALIIQTAGAFSVAPPGEDPEPFRREMARLFNLLEIAVIAQRQGVYSKSSYKRIAAQRGIDNG